MNAKPEPRTITRMVRTTPEEDAQILTNALPDEAPAVTYRRLALSGGAPDYDPRVVEVRARNASGRFDMRLGVFTASIAAGMQALYEAKGWTVTLTEVPEQPKVGAELPDPQAQIATLTLEDITDARLRDQGRRAPKT